MNMFRLKFSINLEKKNIQQNKTENMMLHSKPVIGAIIGYEDGAGSFYGVESPSFVDQVRLI